MLGGQNRLRDDLQMGHPADAQGWRKVVGTGGLVGYVAQLHLEGG